MKLLCMLEPRRNMMGPYLTAAAKSLGSKLEYLEGNWTGPMDEDVASIRRREETDGPNVFPIPEDCIKYNDAEILYTNWVPIGAECIAQMPNLKIIGVVRAGLENIDVKAATEHGVLVVNAGGHNANAVSDFAISLMLAETRNIGRLHHNMMNGIWKTPREQDNIHDMEGRTVGLVGFGFIGKLMARKLSGFNMKFLSYDPFVKQEDVDKLGLNVKMVDLDTLMSESDFVSIHARLLPATYHIIGEHELSLMKPGAFFINTARAGLVDTEALIKVLQEHKIAGAGIDVFDEEPLPLDSPFYKMDNVTITPHRAGVTVESTSHSPQMVIDRMANLFDGKPADGLVNPEVLNNPEFQKWLAEGKAALGR